MKIADADVVAVTEREKDLVFIPLHQSYFVQLFSIGFLFGFLFLGPWKKLLIN